jgi:two-component system NtrC family sensor kinase
VGLAVDNVRFYETLTAQVEARTRELRDTQATLVQSEKMAAMGTMVAGLAHELNTPLGSVQSSQATINSALGKLRAQAKLSAKDERLAQVVDSAGDTLRSGVDRIANIVTQLRHFSRLDAAETDYADLNDCIRAATAMLTSLVPIGGSLDLDLGELPMIRCNPSEINQAIYNITLNALEAIDGHGSVRITSTRTEHGVVIAITDDGSGIAEADLARVFDPGFTTKGVGVGGGMGLSIAHQSLHAQGGRLEITSEPGRGTTATLRLVDRPV